MHIVPLNQNLILYDPHRCIVVEGGQIAAQISQKAPSGRVQRLSLKKSVKGYKASSKRAYGAL